MMIWVSTRTPGGDRKTLMTPNYSHHNESRQTSPPPIVPRPLHTKAKSRVNKM